jgi:S1-C subfamily serine protease
MDGGGSYSDGDLPEEPDVPPDEAGVARRGWLPPEDRLWRHPSEIARHGMPRSPSLSFDGGDERLVGRRLRRSSLTAGAGTVAAVAADVAVGVTLADTSGTATRGSGITDGGNAVTLATSSSTSSPTVSPDVNKLVTSLRPSLVGLEPAGGGGTHMTGVVLPGGNLVVTAASDVAGLWQLDVLTADGKRHRGVVMATDSHSGVAVVGTDGGLSPATFADEAIAPGDFALVACLCESSAAAAVSTVTQVGLSLTPQGGPALVDAIEAEMPLRGSSWGGVLVDDHGRVMGVLDGLETKGTGTFGIFVPAPLAEGVAVELAQTRQVSHGWLGVVCSDGTAPGATVTRVMAGSPAALAGLQPGDVVVAVGPHPVSTLGELQERLYTVPPGAAVQLSVSRGQRDTLMTVTLANSPGS